MLGTAGTSSRYAATSDIALDGEVAEVERALDQRGVTSRDELRVILVAGEWGPGRFGAALRAAVREGRAERLPSGAYQQAGGPRRGSVNRSGGSEPGG